MLKSRTHPDYQIKGFWHIMYGKWLYEMHQTFLFYFLLPTKNYYSERSKNKQVYL